MTKIEAIKWLQEAEILDLTVGHDKDREAVNMGIDAIKQTTWIPCSERLPKEDGRYQVTRYDYVTNTEFIDILWYENSLWWNRHSTGDYAVIAWMPSPEPWKGEQNERYN